MAAQNSCWTSIKINNHFKLLNSVNLRYFVIIVMKIYSLKCPFSIIRIDHSNYYPFSILWGFLSILVYGYFIERGLFSSQINLLFTNYILNDKYFLVEIDNHEMHLIKKFENTSSTSTTNRRLTETQNYENKKFFSGKVRLFNFYLRGRKI